VREPSSTVKRIIRKISHYYVALGVPGVLLFLYSKLSRTHPLFKKTVPGTEHPIYLRVGTTDISVFRQVLLERQYDFPLSYAPKYILDAGANVGLSALFFAIRYPKALILAIEPESSNFAVLKRNVAAYPQIKPLQAALWHDNRALQICDVGDGSAGFQMKEVSPNNLQATSVPSVTIDDIMEASKIPFIDLLKLDIEGAEKEVFQNSSRWIGKVGAVMVELHDHIRPGCRSAFVEATKSFSSEMIRGEAVMKQRSQIAPEFCA
jgi:FkbM family methyltransferase